MSEHREEKKVPVAVPERSIATEDEFLKINEKKKTKRPAVSPPKNANNETGERNLSEKLAAGRNP